MSDQSPQYASQFAKGVILCCVSQTILSPELFPLLTSLLTFYCIHSEMGFFSNLVLLTLFLDFMINHKLILQLENERRGILVLLSIFDLCSPADTGDTLERGEQKTSSPGLSLSLIQGQLTTSQAVLTWLPKPLCTTLWLLASSLNHKPSLLWCLTVRAPETF